MSDGPELWVNLKCECGGEQYSSLVALRWKAGGGITTSPKGYQCVACMMVVDTAYLIKRAEHAAKQRDLQAVQEEVDALAAQVARPKIGHNVRV